MEMIEITDQQLSDLVKHELDAGHPRIARVWLDMIIERERAGGQRPDVVPVPVLRDTTCSHGYRTYAANGRTYHGATCGICKIQEGFDKPPTITYAFAWCATCGAALAAHDYTFEIIEGSSAPAGVIWIWAHEHPSDAVDHEPVAASPITVTNDGRKLFE